jgi:hypothetical protein
MVRRRIAALSVGFADSRRLERLSIEGNETTGVPPPTSPCDFLCFGYALDLNTSRKLVRQV